MLEKNLNFMVTPSLDKTNQILHVFITNTILIYILVDDKKRLTTDAPGESPSNTVRCKPKALRIEHVNKNRRLFFILTLKNSRLFLMF